MATIRLAALGDSFVEGRGDPGADGRWVGWVSRLADLLGIGQRGCLNLGAFEATTQRVADEQLPVALVRKAPLIGVIVGVNDLVSDYEPARFATNLNRVFDGLSGQGTTLFTATYPDIPGNLSVPKQFRELLRGRFARANDTLRAAVARTHALCLDVTEMPEWRDPARWSADGLHPSPLGHQRFAEEVANLIAWETGVAVAQSDSALVGAAGPGSAW